MRITTLHSNKAFRDFISGKTTLQQFRAAEHGYTTKTIPMRCHHDWIHRTDIASRHQGPFRSCSKCSLVQRKIWTKPNPITDYDIGWRSMYFEDEREPPKRAPLPKMKARKKRWWR